VRSLLPASIVLSPYTKMALPVIGHASYITITSGFLMTDVLALRVLLICGYTGLVAFHSLHERPLRIPLSWSAFFVLVNSTMALILARDRFPGKFEPEQVGQRSPRQRPVLPPARPDGALAKSSPRTKSPPSPTRPAYGGQLDAPRHVLAPGAGRFVA
jgi:hypothetical protein